MEHFVFMPSDPPPFYAPGAIDYVGKPIGLKELLYRRGWFVDGMTRHGPKHRDAVAEAKYDKKWKKHDLVYRNEDGELYLYKVVSVSPDHEEVCDDAHISCRLFIARGCGLKHTLSDMTWNDFEACTLSDVPLEEVVVNKSIFLSNPQLSTERFLNMVEPTQVGRCDVENSPTR